MDTLSLDEIDLLVLRQLDQLDERKLLELLRDLRQERELELQIYHAREQWFWIPWTACLASTIAALMSADPIVAGGVPIVLGITATALALWRKCGLVESLAIIDCRHKWTVQIAARNDRARVWPLSFEDRIARHKHGIADERHHRSFRLPLYAIYLTPILYIALGAIAIEHAWPGLILSLLRP